MSAARIEIPDYDKSTMPKGMSENELNLEPADLLRLGEQEFRKAFVVSAKNLVTTFGIKALPDDFPVHPTTMSTAEMMEALTMFNEWFDP
jgi:hypothetical protein